MTQGAVGIEAQGPGTRGGIVQGEVRRSEEDTYFHSLMLQMMWYRQDSRMLVERKAISAGGGSGHCLCGAPREVSGKSV